jgi:lipopolysaccharide export system permease protein
VTTFDRYLFRRFLHTFVILFVTVFGLYVVIDGFTNVDGFQEGTDDPVVVLRRMASYYAYQSSMMFDLMGPTVAVASVMVVAALLVKHSEYQPILAAGVPLLRLTVPFIVGLLAVTALILCNQEYMIPQIAHKLQGPRSELKAALQEVTPQIDYTTGIIIEGNSLDVDGERIIGARFVLTTPEVVAVPRSLDAETARYVPRTSTNPAGWVLTNTSPEHYEDLPLTPRGIKFVVPVKGTNEIFVRSDISFDLICDNSRSASWQATPELIKRIRNPALSESVARDQTFLLHKRLVQPLLNLLAGLACIPLVIRRESRNLVASIAMATGVQGVMLGALHGATLAGKAGFVPADVAAWLPVIICGTLAGWATGYAQT